MKIINPRLRLYLSPVLLLIPQTLQRLQHYPQANALSTCWHTIYMLKHYPITVSWVPQPKGIYVAFSFSCPFPTRSSIWRLLSNSDFPSLSRWVLIHQTALVFQDEALFRPGHSQASKVVAHAFLPPRWPPTVRILSRLLGATPATFYCPRQKREVFGGGRLLFPHPLVPGSADG